MVKTRRITKKEAKSQAEFREGFAAIMQSIGAEFDPTPHAWHPWSIATRAGVLKFCLSSYEIPGFRTIFGRFEDPGRARKFRDCNPYSGKWNHHYCGSDNQAYLDDFRRQLTSILIPKEES